MTGLEKIISRIADESNAKCQKMMDDAKEEASRIYLELIAVADSDAKKIVEDARQKAVYITEGAKNAALVTEKSSYLEVRNAVVNDALAEAFEKIENLPEEEYFDLLFKVFLKNYEPGKCEMRLSKKDLERLPEDFEMKLNRHVFETTAVSISKTPVKLSSGFILSYDDFEIDCSLISLFEENMDDLKDNLCNLFFT